VLERVVGGVADVRLGVDDQPRLARRGQHVAGVQVGGQQDLAVRGGRELAEQREAGADQAGIQGGQGGLVRAGGGGLVAGGGGLGTGGGLAAGGGGLMAGGEDAFGPVGPPLAHLVQGGERMTGARLDPQAVQQGGDHGVLLGFRPGGQLGARPAPLQEQRPGRAEVMRGVQADGAVPGPGPQPVGLVRRLRVRPGDLQHQVGAGAVAGGRDPGGLAGGLERLAGRERPAFPGSPDHLGPGGEPGLALFLLGGQWVTATIRATRATATMVPVTSLSFSGLL
jgi:hypothetical protein